MPSPSAPSLRETVLSPRLVVLTLGGDGPLTSYGTNCVAFAGEGGSVVVDPLIAPAQARLVEEALRARGFPPVRHVVLTHHHTDHALGASWFASRGAVVIAHRHCAAAMADQHPALVAARRLVPELSALFADAEPHVPAALFDESHAIGAGDARVLVSHLGPGHTRGDAIVVFPSEDAVACGDLVFRGYYYNYEEADVGALPRRLASLGSLPVSRFIPGHGPAGGRAVVEEQARYHGEVEKLVRSAASAEEARASIAARFPGRAYAEGIESAVLAFGRGATRAAR